MQDSCPLERVNRQSQWLNSVMVHNTNAISLVTLTAAHSWLMHVVTSNRGLTTTHLWSRLDKLQAVPLICIASMIQIVIGLIVEIIVQVGVQCGHSS